MTVTNVTAVFLVWTLALTSTVSFAAPESGSNRQSVASSCRSHGSGLTSSLMPGGCMGPNFPVALLQAIEQQTKTSSPSAASSPTPSASKALPPAPRSYEPSGNVK